MTFHAQKQANRSVAPAGGVLQRKCDKCRKKKAILQRYAADLAPDTVPPVVHEVLRSPGAPLDPSTRAFMEPRFGHDFSRVRVHADTRAAESARSVNALAYTVGRDVVFSEGGYKPHLYEGSKLLAHELVHVVQQERGGSAPEISSGAAHEREAEAVARAAINAEVRVPVIGATGVGIARTPLDLTNTNEPPDLSDWKNHTPNLTNRTVWSDTRLKNKLDEIEQ